jgi:hypothetical protein
VLDSESKGKLVIFALTPARVEVVPLAHHLHAGRFAHAA